MKILKLVRTCLARPAAWEGIDEQNQIIYIRYRWGQMTMRQGSPNEEFDIARMPLVFNESIGDNFDGLIDYADMKKEIESKTDFTLPENEEEQKDELKT